MKKAVIMLSISLFVSTSVLNAQNLAIYRLWDLDGWNIGKDVGYISLSDLYWIYNIYSDNPDSPALPDLTKMKKEDRPYFVLNAKYRARFFSKTLTLETDTVFIYDYATDVLVSFPVKDMNLVACLNGYAHYGDFQREQHEYHIGFEIDKKLLVGFSPYYTNALVSIGKENPFVRGGMEVVVWTKINVTDFPAEKAQINTDTVFYRKFERGDAFIYEWENFRYFIQEWGYFREHPNGIETVWEPAGRQLLVIEVRTGNLIAERVFATSEGLTLVPLDIEGMDSDEYYCPLQWTGRLFKNTPPVVFDFLYDSFGCPIITVLGLPQYDIYIRCDNRH